MEPDDQKHPVMSCEFLRYVTEGYSTWLPDGAPQGRSGGETTAAERRYIGINATLYGNGEAVAVNRLGNAEIRGGASYLGKDVLGSVRSRSNENGQLEDRYEFDAFGKPYKGDLNSGVNLGYTGKPYDTTTGMYNYGYRDYQPEVARFTTIDPIRDGANWFAYVNNDPVNYIDLWGLACISASDAVYRQQEVMTIIWHEEIDKSYKSTGTYSGVWTAADPDGYASAGTFSGSQLNFDSIPNTTGISHSIAGAESIQNVRVADIIQGSVGSNIIITRDDRPTRDYSTSSEWYNQDGSVRWTGNNGFANGSVTVTLPAGTQIDRYGGDTGSFAAPIGTPYNVRSLPPESDNAPYTVYTVQQDVKVQSGTAAPAFGQPGGGVQYLLPDTIRSLLDNNIIGETRP